MSNSKKQWIIGKEYSYLGSPVTLLKITAEIYATIETRFGEVVENVLISSLKGW